MQRRRVGTERGQIKNAALLLRNPNLLCGGESSHVVAAPVLMCLNVKLIHVVPAQTVCIVFWMASHCAKILRPLKTSLQKKKKKKKKDVNTAMVRFDLSPFTLCNLMINPHCCH